ncbi:MAG: septum formation initiator family protein [Pelagibacterales bacterium]|nr:septum formation initiator family protein [Pelagibacterales bacterium]
MFLYDFVKKHNITKLLFITYFSCLCLTMYFFFCTVFGSKGLIEYFSLRSKVIGRESEKRELLSKIHSKENMVNNMSLESLDLDLLDEQARKVLGYAGKNEIVIFQDQENSNNQKTTIR